MARDPAVIKRQQRRIPLVWAPFLTVFGSFPPFSRIRDPIFGIWGRFGARKVGFGRGFLSWGFSVWAALFQDPGIKMSIILSTHISTSVAISAKIGAGARFSIDFRLKIGAFSAVFGRKSGRRGENFPRDGRFRPCLAHPILEIRRIDDKNTRNQRIFGRKEAEFGAFYRFCGRLRRFWRPEWHFFGAGARFRAEWCDHGLYCLDWGKKKKKKKKKNKNQLQLKKPNQTKQKNNHPITNTYTHT
jgi:hypothetical protein